MDVNVLPSINKRHLLYFTLPGFFLGCEKKTGIFLGCKRKD